MVSVSLAYQMFLFLETALQHCFLLLVDLHSRVAACSPLSLIIVSLETMVPYLDFQRFIMISAIAITVVATVLQAQD